MKLLLFLPKKKNATIHGYQNASERPEHDPGAGGNFGRDEQITSIQDGKRRTRQSGDLRACPRGAGLSGDCHAGGSQNGSGPGSGADSLSIRSLLYLQQR